MSDDVRREAFGVGERTREHVLGVERVDPVHPLEPHVLLAGGELDLLAQDLRVEQILDADPDPRRLVGVGRPDPAARRPDLELPEPALARAVERDVPRHDQVGVAGDVDEAVGAETAASSSSSSAISTAGSTTHPAPIALALPG